MFLRRPVNQWIGLVAAAASLIQVLIVTLLPDINPVTVATIIGSVSAFLAVLIAFLAGTPPTVSAGDKVMINTPSGQPNRVLMVTTTTGDEVGKSQGGDAVQRPPPAPPGADAGI